MAKVLIVDDSALMRRQLSRILTEAGFEVVTARNGAEGLRLAVEAAPDVITLDVNMPEMDGLTMLSRLMVECPKPVVMVSSLTEQGALATFEALELGAVDYVHKPDGTVSHRIDDVQREIVGKVTAASGARIRRSRGLHSRLQAERSRSTPPPPPRLEPIPSGELPCVVLIGVSTGGPGTLEEILCGLTADFPAPIVVAQHMPANFTGVFARRLDDACALTVQEVRVPTPLRPGNVYVGRGDADVLLSKRGSEVVAAAVPSTVGLWHPSVDRMVESAMKVVPPAQLIGVELTGMGNDGAEQMTRLRQAGGRTIAESEETAVVFGMPQELIKRGGAEIVLPSHAVARHLTDWAAAARRRQRR